jgi:photosystem II stability/assembly factor-like uncharacterized protein
MAKAGLLFVGTDDGMVLFSNPNNIGRWLRIGHELRGQAIDAIWPLADNPLVLYAAGGGMPLQRSDDGGQSWRAALDAEAAVVSGSHGAPETLYLGATDGQVYRSDDAGASWAACPQGPRPPSNVVGLIVAPADARRLYLGLADGGVWTSPDGGATWAPFGGGLPAAASGLAAVTAGTSALYAMAAGALYRCAEAEGRWEPIAAAPAAGGPLAALAGKVPVLLLGQSASRIARSDDDGSTWTAVADEVDWGGRVSALAAASYHIDTAFAGSVGGALAASSDRGRTWQQLKQQLPSIRSIAAARLA